MFEENSQAGNQTDPKFLLERVMKDKNVSFDQLKARLAKEGFSGAEELESTADIPKVKVFELIQRIKKKT